MTRWHYAGWHYVAWFGLAGMLCGLGSMLGIVFDSLLLLLGLGLPGILAAVMGFRGLLRAGRGGERKPGDGWTR